MSDKKPYLYYYILLVIPAIATIIGVLLKPILEKLQPIIMPDLFRIGLPPEPLEKTLLDLALKILIAIFYSLLMIPVTIYFVQFINWGKNKGIRKIYLLTISSSMLVVLYSLYILLYFL